MATKSTSKQKRAIQKFAPIGLWTAGIATLSAIIALIFKLLAFINILTSITSKALNLWLGASAALILVGLAVFAMLDPRKVRDFLTGRQARHGSNALIMLIAFFFILVVVNAFVYQNPKSWDLTESKTNSLAPETVNALSSLPAPVHAIAFFTSNISKSSAQTLLNNAKSKSNGKFTFEFIDPNNQPAKAQQYKVTQDGTIVLLLNGHQELFTSSSESDFTNSLVKLMNPGERTVYFLTGHGEHNSETASDKAYTRARAVLESKNYTVKTLNLIAQNKVPADALSVIISGPTQPITAEELKLLQDYVTNGGSLVVLEDPNLATTGTPAKDPLEDYLATSWGIKVNDDMIIDPSSNQIIVAVENTYADHPITKSLNSQNLVAFFPTASSLTVKAPSSEITATQLVQTIDRAWGETDFAALQNNQVAYDAGKDFPGPLTVAAAGENSNGKGRVVVFGDSDFASDAYFDQYGNSDMFINSVDWAAGQENMISLTTKQPVTREMRPLTSLTVILLALAFVIVLPGLIIAGGVASWLVRRARG